MECECVYVDKLHCTLNGVCDYTSSCVLHRSCPRPPDPSPTPSLSLLPFTPSLSLSPFLPLPPQCLLGNHVVTLPDSLLLKSAVDKNSPRPVMWKRFSRHTAYILPLYCHPQSPTHPPTLQLLTFLPLSNRSTRVFPSSAHL